MTRIVGIGHQDFAKLRMKDNFYIDKTDFIREWWESDDEVTLITRPRRFGKTLNMSMLEKFFSVDYQGREDLFQGLAIWDNSKFRSLQGTYPVLFLSFAGIKENTFQQARKQICQSITDLYNKNDFLLEGNLLNDKEKEFFHRISAEMEDYMAASSLRMLSGFLERYYGKKVIILLDEYDTPMQEAFVFGYWNELAQFTRSLFNSTFKTNPGLERAIMTGITRVSRESVFSDLNNLKVITTTSEKYASSFGFTETEVMSALEEYGLADKMQDVKCWYDGFTFGEITDIYNPWSIINYLDTGKFKAYWANTSSNALVNKLIRESSAEIKRDFEMLIRGNAIQKNIDEQIVFEQLSENETAIWSLMLACGYLKVSAHETDEMNGRETYGLTITNREVRNMFETLVRGWFAVTSNAYNDFMKALLNDDIDAMNQYMNRVALNTFSFFDTGKNLSEESEPERFYHGFVLGLMVELEDKYILTSNRESGFGRYDVVMEPRINGLDAVIMEFKVFNPRQEQSLKDTVCHALDQIEEKKYEAGLRARGVKKEQIRKYGFAFRGKEVLIGQGH